jgi:type VI secretion system secreted protein VgrG
VNQPARTYQASFVSRAAALPIRVTRFSGREEISRTYSFDVEIALPHADPVEVSEALLGERGHVVLASKGIERTIPGVVRRVRPFVAEGTQKDQSRVRLTLVPRVWLLGRGSGYRIFQDVTVPELCSTVLRERDVPVRLDLVREYPRHDYLVQYDESEWAFLTRHLAMEGIAFGFDPSGEDGEVLVLSDRASFLGSLEPDEALPWHADAGFAGEDPRVLSFRRTRRIREGSASVSAFDYRRPLHNRKSESHLPRRSETTARGARARHVETRDAPRIDQRLADIRLEQDRRDERFEEGTASHPLLSPGKRFVLVDGPMRDLEGTHHVVRVEHRFEEGAEITYRNRFASVPDGVTYRPPAPRRRLMQVVETATVVGPAGQEIHTDELGRIKVHFHWDELGARDERASCWLRAAQPWTGAGWGFQFIPRVGTEVLVAFLGGNADAPIVIGSAYNAVNPPVFALPGSKSRSGIRTRSTREGTGFNEISFEDRTGHEQLHLRAERNLDVTVLNNETHRVGGSSAENVTEHRFSVVGGNRLTSVGGNSVETVAGDASQTVSGDRTDRVEGNHATHVTGRSDSVVEGDADRRVVGRSREHVEGTHDMVVLDDLTLRAHGALTLVVGAHDAKRSYGVHVEGTLATYSSDQSEIVADEGITLRCGESSLVIRPEAIELHAPSVLLAGKGAWLRLADDSVKLHANGKLVAVADEKVLLKGSQASVSLTSEAKVGGQSVKLGATDSESLQLDEEEGELTTIVLVDRQNRPLPGQRYRIVLSDGSERSGVVDQDGRAQIRLPRGGRVFFPDLGQVEAT